MLDFIILSARNKDIYETYRRIYTSYKNWYRLHLLNVSKEHTGYHGQVCKFVISLWINLTHQSLWCISYTIYLIYPHQYSKHKSLHPVFVIVSHPFATITKTSAHHTWQGSPPWSWHYHCTLLSTTALIIIPKSNPSHRYPQTCQLQYHVLFYCTQSHNNVMYDITTATTM